MLRIALLKQFYQRRGGAGFADGYGMQPDDRLSGFCVVETESFADVLQIFRLLARAPSEA